MRCFYCARTGRPASTEHIPSAYLGSRLTTRRVCKGCNERANLEIDDHMAKFLMVQMPKALADVRSIRRQGKQPNVEVDAVVSATGEPVRQRFTPQGREARRANGELVRDVVEVHYGFASDLWVQFIAKVALGCAAQLFSDDWLDERVAISLRSLLWHGPIDNAIWPEGIAGWPDELEPANPIRRALGDDRHLVGLVSDKDSTAIAMLFGGQIVCQLPLPGVKVPGSGSVWVLDWHPGDPPAREDYDDAIERMMRQRG